MKLPFLSQRGFAPIVLVIAVIAAAVGGYFAINYLNKPARIKEKTEVVHPIFKDFKRSVEQVAEHLKEEPSGDDADSSERYGEKGKGLIKVLEDNLGRLKPLVEKVNISDADGYKKKLNEYILKSEELLKFERDNVKLSLDYAPLIRDYEELAQDLSGVSNYIYSDPATYIKQVNEAVEKEGKVIKGLESLDMEGEFGRYHEAFIKTLVTEKQLLEKMVSAVRNRDDNAVVAAVQEYSQSQQDNAKDLSRIQDEVKDKYTDLINELESISEDVEDQFNDLKSKFKF